MMLIQQNKISSGIDGFACGEPQKKPITNTMLVIGLNRFWENVWYNLVY